MLATPVRQGGRGIAIKDLGSFFFEVTTGHGLTKYVSGRLTIYGNGISNNLYV